jgi:HD-GYP domain-containing protein (c-di-GMP phosphodiesterase class II)
MADYSWKTKKRLVSLDPRPVKLEYLVTGTLLPCDVYAKDKSSYQLVMAKGEKYTVMEKAKLQGSGVSELYVDEGDIAEVTSVYKKSIANLRPDKIEDKLSKYSAYRPIFYNIDRKLLVAGEKLPFELVISKHAEFCKLTEGDDVLTLDQIDPLGTSGDLMIASKDIPRYLEYMNSLMRSDNLQQQDKKEIKDLARKENLKILMRKLFADPTNEEVLSEIVANAHGLVKMIQDSPGNAYALLSKGQFNYFTYIHAINVAILSIGLGMTIGLKKDDLNVLAIGGLLHDIGASRLPETIICRMGKMTETEFEGWKTHVEEGEKLIRSYKGVPEKAIYAVLHHHEKNSGTGYPAGLSGDRIHMIGKIVALADAYDGITTRKPLKQESSSYDAMRILVSEANNYDPSLLKLFVSMLT